MIESRDIVGFDWDEGNSRKNENHGVSQSEAEQVFFSSPLIMQEDEKHSRNEPRIHALGMTNARRLLHLTFTPRFGGSRVRVISARDTHRKEREVYARKTEKNT